VETVKYIAIIYTGTVRMAQRLGYRLKDPRFKSR